MLPRRGQLTLNVPMPKDRLNHTFLLHFTYKTLLPIFSLSLRFCMNSCQPYRQDFSTFFHEFQSTHYRMANLNMSPPQLSTVRCSQTQLWPVCWYETRALMVYICRSTFKIYNSAFRVDRTILALERQKKI